MVSETALLATFWSPPKDSVSIKLALGEIELISGFEVTLPNWIPGAEVRLSGDITIEMNSIKKALLLAETDRAHILISVASSLTHRTQNVLIDLDVNRNQCLEHFERVFESSEVGGTLGISCSLLIDPDFAKPRELGSPAGEMTVVYGEEFFASLEGTAPLATVTQRDLKGALWNFELSIPSDPQDWLFLEWPEAVKIEIDIKCVESLKTSSELKTALMTDLVMRILELTFSTDGALEVLSESVKGGSFRAEVLKWLRLLLQLQPEFLDVIKSQWQIERNEIYEKCQREILRSFRKIND